MAGVSGKVAPKEADSMKPLFLQRTEKYGNFFILLFCYFIVAVSIVVRIIMYVKVRSLWLDEAMLAESIITRGFSSLFSGPLVNNQTAPMLYVAVVKILGMLFGYTEASLRIFSLFAFLGVLALEYLILSQIFKIHKIWTALALCLTSTINIYMRYSNELKPYMGDVFFVLFILWMYYLYTHNKIDILVLTASSIGCLLFSTPVVFFIAGIFTVEFVHNLTQKDRKKTVTTIMAGMLVLFVFAVYYLLWLQPVAESEGMINYWKNMRFDIFPKNKEEILYDLKLIRSLLGKQNLLYFPLAVIGFVLTFIKKERMTFVIGASLIFLLIVSSIEKYPFRDRLCLFLFVLNIMYCFIFFDRANFIDWTKFKILDIRQPQNSSIVKIGLKYFFLIFSFFMLIVNNSGFIHFSSTKLYLQYEEANPLIEYVKQNIKPGEYLYAYSGAKFIVNYKNGYGNNKIGPVNTDNIIWGGDRNHWINADKTEEFLKIISAKKAYLLFYHHWLGIDKGLEFLENNGFLHEVGSFYDTSLYYFTLDKADPKINETFQF
jgi:hypothetical protein